MIDLTDIDPNSWQGIAVLRSRCESQAVSEGLSGVELFFRSQGLFTDALSQFPTYRQRQREWFARQLGKSQAPFDTLREALEAIRDGHNDPRGLANEVLSSLERAK